jgi:hypothetical protein
MQRTGRSVGLGENQRGSEGFGLVATVEIRRREQEFAQSAHWDDRDDPGFRQMPSSIPDPRVRGIGGTLRIVLKRSCGLGPPAGKGTARSAQSIAVP